MTTVRARVASFVVALLAVCGAAGLLAVAPGAASAQTTARAVVVVDLGSLGGGVQTRVIEFSGTVSGLEALQLAGASPSTITYGPLGQAVCQLFGAGDQPVPGQCPGGWVYFRAPAGAGGWSQSSLGASNTVVHDGDVEGWRYGGGTPPFPSFCSVAGCAPPPTTPTAAPAVPSGGGTNTDGGVSVAGATASGNATAGTTPGSAVAGAGDGPAAAGTASGATATTTAPERSSRSSDRRVGRTVAAGTGPAGTGGGGGSPVGVIVAVAVVAALVGGGFALRRRRAA